MLWKEIIKKAESDGIEHLVLVTGDVKEDWWLKKRGKNLNARLELLNEIYSRLPNLKSFYLYDTSSFLKSAKSQLNLDISEATIEQANELVSDSSKSKNENNIHLYEKIAEIKEYFQDIHLNINQGLQLLPTIAIEENIFKQVLYEIFSNVAKHSLDSELNIGFNFKTDKMILSFTNILKVDRTIRFSNNVVFHSNPSTKSKSGLLFIKNKLSKYGITLEERFSHDTFSLQLTFPENLYKN